MLSFLESIFKRPASDSGDVDKALLELAIEKTVDGTDPRLRLVRGYRRKLEDCVATSIRFVQKAAEEFYPPVTLDARRYASDPEVRAFFGSATDIPELMRESKELRDFLDDPTHASLPQIYAGMGMDMVEKPMLAPALRGGVMQRDVMRTAVNFTNRNLVLPAASEAELKREVKERIFIELVSCALAELASMQEHKEDLERNRILLRTKLRHLQSRRAGLEPIAGPAAAGEPDNVGQIEQRLEEIQHELETLTTSTGAAERYFSRIVAVMGEPDGYVRLERASVALTPMGFKQAADVEEEVNEIGYTRIVTPTLAARVGRLVVFAREHVPPRQAIDFRR